jgi:hypothetical protein
MDRVFSSIPTNSIAPDSHSLNNEHDALVDFAA